MFLFCIGLAIALALIALFANESADARILRVQAESIFSAHGMLAGDDIVLMNDHEIRRPADLAQAAPTLSGADELEFVLWRGNKKYIYTFYRSTAAE